MSDRTPSAQAMMIAAQCWCDPETAEIEMDSRLAIAFAKRLDPLLDARPTLTDAECAAIEYTLNRLAWPPDATQMELLARSLGPVCVTPEHSVKATLRGLLRRLGYTATTGTQEGDDE